ncbi:MAG: NfeD family protein [Dehalococcoidia bacterium]|nr:NfeD family protein [Dehalococcoidia bacterium]
MKGRGFLAYAVFMSVLEEVALLGLCLWLLPALGIRVPLWLVVTLAVIVGGYSIVLTRLNLRSLGRRPVTSPDIGLRARVVTSLEPDGYVRVGNELWSATSEGASLEKGRHVTIVRIEGMRVFVKPESDERVLP